MTLIQELKSDHEFLATELSKVKDSGFVSEEAKKILFECKTALLNHLKKEDEFLYPKLNKAAETNENLKKSLDMFAKDMEGISKAALDFFSKYESNAQGMEFAKDLGGLLSVLGQRIRKEEDILYKKFDELE